MRIVSLARPRILAARLKKVQAPFSATPKPNFKASWTRRPEQRRTYTAKLQILLARGRPALTIGSGHRSKPSLIRPPLWPSVSAASSVAFTGLYEQKTMADEALHSRAGPSVILPILCSAGLVAAVYAAEFGRLYRAQSRRPADRKGLSRSSGEPRAAQQGRALQPGRGRPATSPWQIPWRGWKDILWRTYERIGEDRLLAVGAGVVFYGLLALFPAVTAMVSLYGLFAKA